MANEKARRLLFGGSFDPPHLGHLALANTAAQAFGVPSITFIPNRQNPLKEKTKATTPEQRLTLLQYLLSETAHEIATWELDRPGPSWTFETLLQARQQDDRLLTFLIGADCLNDLAQWKNLPQLFDLADFCLVHRLGVPLEIPQDLRDILGSKMDQLVDLALPMAPQPFSSTQIREDLLQGKKPLGLPDSLFEYICQQGLYGWTPGQVK